jgi:hypothetical protein
MSRAASYKLVAFLICMIFAELKIKGYIMQFSDLRGSTLTDVQDRGSEIVFTLDNGKKYQLFHQQDCCESVTVEDISGDLKDLIGSPLTMAEETFSSENGKPNAESFTWTYYKLATVQGYVTIRWYGSSNGYYSERVDFCEVY